MATKKDSTQKARVIPEGKVQVNFNINSDTLDKVNYIAFAKKSNKSVVFNEATDMYVEDFEKKNGKIKLPKTPK